MADVPRYITGICCTCKIDKYSGGDEFIKRFCDSIHDWRNVHLNGFEYVNDNDDICYFLLMVGPHHDERSTEVRYTHHTLSKSFGYNDSKEVIVEERKALTWLKQRACNELHLSSQTTHQLMYKSQSGPTIDVTQCKIYHGSNVKNVTAQEVKHIIQESNPAASGQGWRYILMNKTKHNRTFLECIIEILEYSRHCDQPEKFFEDLKNEIQDCKDCNLVSYPFFHLKEPCALVIAMQTVNANVIEIACRFQTDEE